MTQLLPDQRLAGYRVIGPLGRGGMAAVYRAYESDLDREVALKVLPAELLEQSGFAERFAREARLIARLEHSNIVPVYASGVDQGIPWMALRLVSGGTLQDLLEAGSLDQREALRLFQLIARALDHAHRHGVLHRDLKPQNVLVSADGEVYLADFGIARLMAGSTALTGTGAILGTPHYMAPEQAQGEKLGPPCDIYALAVILYRWLCGTVPFDADTPLAVLMQHVQSPVPVAPMQAIPHAAREVLLRGLAKDPTARWETAASMVEALEQALTAGVAPVRNSTFAVAAGKAATSAVAAQRPPTMTAPAQSGQPSAAIPARRWPGLLLLSLGLLVAAGWAANHWQVIDLAALTRSGDSPTSAPIAEQASEQSSADPALIGRAQRALQQLGYDVEPSAAMDAATRDAIGQFWRDQDLPLGAGVDSALLKALDNALVRRDLSAWQRALAENTTDAYGAYAMAFPDGQFIAEVDVRLAALATQDQAVKVPRSSEPDAQPTVSASDPAPRRPDPNTVAPRGKPVPPVDSRRADPESVDEAAAARAKASAEAEQWAAQTAAAVQVQRVNQVQSELKRLGRAIEVNGELSEQTRAAITDFERAKGLPESGAVSDELLVALRGSRQWPDPGPGARFSDCPGCPEMVVIPAGRFQMGSPSDEPQRQPSEGPRREVRVAAFALARTEVTFAQWDGCLADGGCQHRPADQGWGGGDRPVVDVSWNDAQAYLAWLRRKTGRDYQLPSEAQWEYAARGGTDTRVYPGSCISSDQANFNAMFPATGCAAGQFRQQTLPVASFAANPFGLHDIHGNVWEWVQDCWNEDYRGAPEDDRPRLSGNCADGTVRGGAWHDWGYWVRAAARYHFPRESRHPYGGFRPARVVER